MPYDDDEDLFGHEFDFVDDEDDDDDDEDAPARGKAKNDEEPEAKPRRRAPAPRDKAPAERPKTPAERPKTRSKPPAPPARRPARPPVDEEPARAPEPEPDLFDDEPVEQEAVREEPAPVPTGPPSDHVVHIYEFGKLKRTIPRKFTDEEAVGFAEEYTRTGKSYGRYAVATPEDEEPSPTFAGASRGN